MRADHKSRRIYFRRRDKVGSQIPPVRRRFFIIDEADYEKIRFYKWHNHGPKGYVRSNKMVYLHRFLIDAPKGFDVDHINGNTFDNRRRNLRLATRQQNQFNSKPTKGRKIKGVSWFKRDKNWHAQIMCNRKNNHLGYFPTQRSAARAYDQMAIKLFGQYARTNFKSNGADRITARR